MSTARRSDQEGWGERLPLLHPDELDADQRALRDQIHEQILPWAQRAGFQAANAQGDPIGPFNVFLHRPGPGRRYLDWSLDDLRGSSLAPGLREIIILTTGVAWQADYEIYAHTAAARHAGLSEPAITAILAGGTSEQLSQTEAAVHRFTTELVETRSVSDDTYEQAIDAVGREGVLDMVNLIGMYLATSATLNAFRVPLPPRPSAARWPAAAGAARVGARSACCRAEDQ